MKAATGAAFATPAAPEIGEEEEEPAPESAPTTAPAPAANQETEAAPAAMHSAILPGTVVDGGGEGVGASSREPARKPDRSRAKEKRERGEEDDDASLRWSHRREPRFYEWADGPGSTGQGAEEAKSSFWLPSSAAPPAKDRTWLRVFCGTWNLQGQRATEDAARVWVPAERIKHHLYVLGTCECEQSIRKSFLVSSKARWERQMAEHLGEDYFLACARTLNAIHIMVFVHRELRPYVWEVWSGATATGMLNFFGNKGSVEVGLRLGHTNLLFVNAHLASGQKKTRERMANFERILLSSKLRPPDQLTLHGAYDRVFFIGDLNWRLDATRAEVDGWFEEGEVARALSRDQLLPLLKPPQRQPGRGGEADDHAPTTAVPGWADFQEAEIGFPPTYKFDHNSDVYDTKKRKVPAWPDRILWRAKPAEDVELGTLGDPARTIRQRSYDSVSALKQSDHRPVFAQFEVLVGLRGFTPPPEKRGRPPAPSTSRGCVLQ